MTHTRNRIDIINRERMGAPSDSEGSGPGLRPEWQEEAREKIWNKGTPSRRDRHQLHVLETRQ